MVEFRFGVSFVMCFDAVATRLFTPPPYPSPASLGGEICLADLAQQADHFDGDLCRFRAFVTGFGASALYGLFDAVGGEHAVDDRDVVAERNMAQGFGAFADDDVKVGGRAFDDGAESDDGVVAGGGGEALRGDAEFECAGDVGDVDVGEVGAVAFQGVDGARFEFVDDEVVEARADDGVARVLEDVVAFEAVDLVGHGVSLCCWRG